MLTKVIEQAKIDRFARWMGHAERIVIVAHVAPDGDAIGSSLGLWHFLNSQEIRVCRMSLCRMLFPTFCDGCRVAKMYYSMTATKNLPIN